MGISQKMYEGRLHCFVDGKHLTEFKDCINRGMRTAQNPSTEMLALADTLNYGTSLENLKHNPRNDNAASQASSAEVNAAKSTTTNAD